MLQSAQNSDRASTVAYIAQSSFTATRFRDCENCDDGEQSDVSISFVVEDFD